MKATARHTNKISSASASDVGRVRSVNEDSLLERPDIGLWAVADGMGGHSRGDVASQRVRDALALVPGRLTGLDMLHAVRAALYDAHKGLLRESADMGEGHTMGTTVVVLLVQNNHFACVWAGDSRCYLLRAGHLERITRDDSLVQDMIDSGALDERQAESHPMANVVTQALGAPNDLSLSTVHGPLEPGDLLLLCSDGLTRMVPEPVIAEILERQGVNGVGTLIAAALEGGGRDNVTAIVVAPSVSVSGDVGPDDSDPDGDDDMDSTVIR